MDKEGAAAFVYAKACGMYARSFVGLRAKKLFEAKRLQDLWVLLYSDEVPLVPEGMLALLLERKSEERAVIDFITLLSAYDNPDPLSRALLSLYDYNNLKASSSSILLGKTEAPFMVDIGPYSILDTLKWPDLEGMTRNTRVAWYNRVPAFSEQIEWETRLDHDYYHCLWDALGSLDAKNRASAEVLIREEIILQNIVWAMRLRVYYDKIPDEIIPMLALSGEGPKISGIVCQDALDILDKPIDLWNEWKSWKYSWLLNPHEEGVPWLLDPRWAQLAADKYLYRLAMRQFHQNPFTVGVLVSFFKIKQLEEHMIRVAAEGLRLGASEKQMSEFMGDSQNV
jgi:vacuolar-type H+-ATPase subunit C/Vma6